jgi:spermidine/putrescine transport system ATP-binding protein
MLKIVDLKKEFLNKSRAIDNLNLSIEEGEFFSLLGPSGCGKSTLLRILAGLEKADSGSVFLNDQRIDFLLPQKRPFNLVFQKYALFPHMTVFENIAFGLRLKKMKINQVTSIVHETLSLVSLTGLENRFPETLSGGQAQRVALARALANSPKVLLLDEPLSALDLKLREHMQWELKSLQKKTGITFIYVTHDQEEAFSLSDRIAVMNKGKIEQIGTPDQLYSSPESHFVARFVGQINSLAAKVVGVERDLVTLDIAGCLIRAQQHKSCPKQIGESALVFVRPEKVSLYKVSEKPTESNVLPAQIEGKVFRGDCCDWRVRIDEQTFLSSLSFGEEMDHHLFQLNEPVLVAFEPNNALGFCKDSLP